MSAPEVAHAALAGGFATRRLFYRALAQALVAAAPPAGAVFETSSRGPPPDVHFRPAHLLGPEGPVSLPGVRAFIGPPRPSPSLPPADARHRFGVLLPSPRTAPADWKVPPIRSVYPDWGAGAPGEGWAAVQVVWVVPDPGLLSVAVRFRVAAREVGALDRLYDALAARLLADWHRATGTRATPEPVGFGPSRDWRRAGIRSIPRAAWCAVPPTLAEETVEVGWADREPSDPSGGGHAVVLGASGTGKTTLLAERASRAIGEGRTAVVLDLHGDLTPAVVARLPPERRRSVVAVDAGARPVVGLAGWSPDDPSVDRTAAHFVAAVKRLTPDGTDLAWGFRLERIFDTFVRLTLESRGSLLDLYALLTDPRRREAARFEPHPPATRRFLDELEPIVRRNPEFLWSAATRLSKVVLVPELAELLAPPDGGLEVERLVRSGRSVLVRLPVAALGPEAATFAAALVLGRIYLGLAARGTAGGALGPTLLVLDEVQGFPPRLVAEILSDSRKFGVEAWVASQYPDRLAPEVRAAAAGAASKYLAFRIPAASAAQVGPWVGLSPLVASEVLATLPVGVALELAPDRGGARWHDGPTPPPPDDGRAWEEAVARTRTEFQGPDGSGGDGAEEGAVDRLLLAILAAEERGKPLGPDEVVAHAEGLPGAPVDRSDLERAWRRLASGPEVEHRGGGLRLSTSGARRVGLYAATGATSESAEHRALLTRAFRVFARRGYAFEIVRQGRFDTRLPDGLFRQLGSASVGAPVDLARTLDRVRSGWAWRAFGGRDVHLEAEVSGARSPARLRRNWEKARARGAFALFLVGDLGRARKVRAVLRQLGASPREAGVWVLGPAWDRREQSVSPPGP